MGCENVCTKVGRREVRFGNTAAHNNTLTLLLLLLSYHRRPRMILRSARAARGRRSGLSQLVYVCGNHGHVGLDGAGMELVFGKHAGQS